MIEGQKLPQDVNIEKVVLGAILFDSETLQDVIGIMFDGLFYLDVHKVIFNTINEQVNNNLPTDLSAIVNKLKTKGKLDYVGGAVYLAQLTNEITSNTEYYIRILTQLYIKRSIVNICETRMNDAYNISEDVFETLNKFENDLSIINAHIIGKDFEGDIKKEAEETYQFLIKPREERLTGIKTGNAKLTDKTGGWNNGDLVIIAARPSHGKTSRTVNFMLTAAADNKRVALFSLETKRREIHTKMFNNVAELDAAVTNTQSWTNSEFERYFKAKEHVRYSNMFIYDQYVLTPTKLKTICRERKRKYGLDIVFVDYLQKMTPNEPSKFRERDISEISSSLKALAMELNIPVIALAQLNRECEIRTDKRPILADLRESGSIEQDADVIITLYNPSRYYDYQNDRDYKDRDLTEEQYKSISEMAVLKHRNGESGFIIEEIFVKSQSKFKEISHHTSDNQYYEPSTESPFN